MTFVTSTVTLVISGSGRARSTWNETKGRSPLCQIGLCDLGHTVLDFPNNSTDSKKEYYEHSERGPRNYFNP